MNKNYVNKPAFPANLVNPLLLQKYTEHGFVTFGGFVLRMSFLKGATLLVGVEMS